MAGTQEHVPIAKLLKDVQTASTNSGLVVGAITLDISPMRLTRSKLTHRRQNPIEEQQKRIVEQANSLAE